jgi:hypothetical protein
MHALVMDSRWSEQRRQHAGSIVNGRSIMDTQGSGADCQKDRASQQELNIPIGQAGREYSHNQAA